MFTISATETGQGSKFKTPNATKLTAGIAQVNGTFYTVPTAELPARPATSVRYTLPTQDEDDPGDTAEIITDAELLQPNEQYAYGLIGRVIVDGEQKNDQPRPRARHDDYVVAGPAGRRQ